MARRGGVLVAMACVLDQFLLGLLEAFGLALSRLHEGTLRLVGLPLAPGGSELTRPPMAAASAAAFGLLFG